MLFDDRTDVLDGAQDGQSAVDVEDRALGPVVGQEALDDEAEILVFDQLLGHRPAHVAGADDEHVVQVPPAGVAPLHRIIDLGPEKGDGEDDGHEVNG